jgi:hypothetical protein
MSQSFFGHPILNSPYDYPARYVWGVGLFTLCSSGSPHHVGHVGLLKE